MARALAIGRETYSWAARWRAGRKVRAGGETRRKTVIVFLLYLW